MLLVFDTTGSMSGGIVGGKIAGPSSDRYHSRKYADANFGIFAAVADYPPDVPWSLKQLITADGSLIQDAINPLHAAGGGDGPEAYGRALYEAVKNDSDIGWRTEAKRLLVLWPGTTTCLMTMTSTRTCRGYPNGRESTSSPGPIWVVTALGR